MRRGVALGAAGVVAAGGVAAGLMVAAGSGTPPASASGGEGSGQEPAAKLAAGQVERRTLVDRQTVDGTLGYGGERTVLSRLSGTVSWLPAVGVTVKPGKPLLKVDGSPVILFDGVVPAYRALQLGVTDGDDVRQLERGLANLGYAPGTVDAEWTADTTAAVNAWRDDLGLEETGQVELGRVVFLPGARRISSREVEIGAASGSGSADGGDGGSGDGGGAGGGGGGTPTEVLKTTSDRRVVTLDVDAADQRLAKTGAKVSVELPDGGTIPGVISKVGRVAESSSDDEGGGGGGEDDGATISVTVKLTGSKGGRLDQAPVNVELARDTRKNVLTVPVTALVAQRGGAYAVDVIDRGRRRLVPVEPGLFADGLVEVQGKGLRDGTPIAVPQA